jgi:hypothetical protein
VTKDELLTLLRTDAEVLALAWRALLTADDIRERPFDELVAVDLVLGEGWYC